MQDEFEYKVQLKIAAKKNKKTHVQSDTQDQRFLVPKSAKLSS